MTLKKLPIGIQTFSTIREEGYLYIDKTQQLHQLTESTGRYFLSRPRRFGKSMLISTLQALYEGRKALFEGLYIYDKWDWQTTYPVIRIDFAGGVIERREQLDHRLHTIFSYNQQRLNLDCDLLLDRGDPAGCFQLLIRQAREHYGQKVVILIDEYDKPILDQIENLTLANSIREGLKNLYSVTKAEDEHIQFVLMTGVSKFSKVSLFSGVNQLKDISLHHHYATICGYTQDDLETQFAQHLVGVDWNKLKRWYNGYNFIGEPVYNPFDVLLFIDNAQRYQNYWFANASPSFLLKLFKQKQYFVPELSSLEVGEEILNSFEIDSINPITLLFQTGYLTIDTVRVNEFERVLYRLRVPNQEVQHSLGLSIIDAYADISEPRTVEYQESLYRALISADMAKIEQIIQSLFAGVAWRNFTNNDLVDSEGYYASVLYAFFASLNATIIPENIDNHGQADMTILLGDQIYIMEFKIDKTKRYRKKKINPALAQILKNNYAQQYLARGKPIHQVGMVFNQTARNLVQMDWETVKG